MSSQADSERSDLERERRELAADEGAERAELAGIYVQRGLTPALAAQVAMQLMQHDALAAHARDELGLSAMHRARPLQAALASASSFAAGAVLPLLVVPSILGVMLGSRIGARLLHTVPAPVVRQLVIVVMLFAGARALLRGLGLWT